MQDTNELWLEPLQLSNNRLGTEQLVSWRKQGYAFVDGLIPATLIARAEADAKIDAAAQAVGAANATLRRWKNEGTCMHACVAQTPFPIWQVRRRDAGAHCEAACGRTCLQPHRVGGRVGRRDTDFPGGA